MFLLRCIGAALWVCLFFTFTCSANAAGAEQQTGKPGPGPRFIDNNNGTITDNLNGLIWLKNADCFDDQIWDNAISLVGKLGNGQCGLSDGSKAGQWRLPSREELAGLIDHKQFNTADWLNLQGFSRVQPRFYWSSTGSDYSSNNAWYVDLERGGSYNGGMNFGYHVWAVRGVK